jgi:hypothetical protein
MRGVIKIVDGPTEGSFQFNTISTSAFRENDNARRELLVQISLIKSEVFQLVRKIYFVARDLLVSRGVVTIAISLASLDVFFHCVMGGNFIGNRSE